MTVCEDCGFVFNAVFDERKLSYDAAYENTQTHSPAFSDHLDQRVHQILREEGHTARTIVEVGCGKGDFLRRLIQHPHCQAQGLGFDPTYTGDVTKLGGRLQFVKSFYDAQAATIPADVVVCRHVIEHIAQPLLLLKSIRQALKTSPHATVYFETPCVDWILRNRVAWDFFYEHCSLFTRHSLTTAFELAGFTVTSCEHVFGGQYLWLTATPATSPATTQTLRAGLTPNLAGVYRITEQSRNANWCNLVHGARQQGPLALWGAGAKGVTFANLVDPHNTLLDCVVDVNPAKQQQFLPGSGHAIVGPTELTARQVRTVLVLNPNYLPEIQRQVAELGLSVNVIDLQTSVRLAA
jgi:SAM-dependent methyltransferase